LQNYNFFLTYTSFEIILYRFLLVFLLELLNRFLLELLFMLLFYDFLSCICAMCGAHIRKAIRAAKLQKKSHISKYIWEIMQKNVDFVTKNEDFDYFGKEKYT